MNEEKSFPVSCCWHWEAPGWKQVKHLFKVRRPQYCSRENTLCGFSLSMAFSSLSSMITMQPRISACCFFINSMAACNVPATHRHTHFILLKLFSNNVFKIQSTIYIHSFQLMVLFHYSNNLQHLLVLLICSLSVLRFSSDHISCLPSIANSCPPINSFPPLHIPTGPYMQLYCLENVHPQVLNFVDPIVLLYKKTHNPFFRHRLTLNQSKLFLF